MHSPKTRALLYTISAITALAYTGNTAELCSENLRVASPPCSHSRPAAIIALGVLTAALSLLALVCVLVLEPGEVWQGGGFEVLSALLAAAVGIAGVSILSSARTVAQASIVVIAWAGELCALAALFVMCGVGAPDAAVSAGLIDEEGGGTGIPTESEGVVEARTTGVADVAGVTGVAGVAGAAGATVATGVAGLAAVGGTVTSKAAAITQGATGAAKALVVDVTGAARTHDVAGGAEEMDAEEVASK